TRESSRSDTPCQENLGHIRRANTQSEGAAGCRPDRSLVSPRQRRGASSALCRVAVAGVLLAGGRRKDRPGQELAERAVVELVDTALRALRATDGVHDRVDRPLALDGRRVDQHAVPATVAYRLDRIRVAAGADHLDLREQPGLLECRLDADR